MKNAFRGCLLGNDAYKEDLARDIEWTDIVPGMVDNVYGIQADVSVESDVQRIFDFAQEKFGRLDIFVNNADSGATKMVWEVSLEE